MKIKILVCLIFLNSVLPMNAQNLFFPYGGFIGNDDVIYQSIISNGWNASNGQDYVGFSVAGNGAQNINEKMRIISNGNIGIGTPTPNAKLDVLTYMTGLSTYNVQNWSTSNSDYNLRLQTVWDGSGINHHFVQKFNGVDYNSLSFFNGRVGIGTRTPIGQFEVYTNLPSAGAYDSQYWSTSSDAYNLRLQTVWDNNGINYHFIQRFNGTDYNSMSLSNGRIGIGTKCPQTTLDVAGTIRAKEVKVEIFSGCDFVFRSDYNLMDLSSLEKFVKTKQHLPEIEPEKEMIENGVNLKELQIKLLQKIEELTLYIIEQNKKIETLQIELKEMKTNSN